MSSTEKSQRQVCTERSLREIFAVTDAEAANSFFKARVIKAEGETRITVSAEGFETYVDFERDAHPRYKKNVEVDQGYIFHKLERKQADCLSFTSRSFMRVDPKAEKQVRIQLKLKDLLPKTKKDIISDILFVKVWEVKEMNLNPRSSKRVKKLIVGDEDFTVTLSFWNDAIKMADKIKPGDVLKLQNVGLDDFEKKTEDQPLNLTFRDRKPVTALQIVPLIHIPLHLQQLKACARTLSISGTIQEFYEGYQYISCPGNSDFRCGKAVPQTDVCQKCRLPAEVAKSQGKDDYIVNIVVFDDNGDTHHLKGFRYIFEQFEGPGMTPEQMLEPLLLKHVRISAKRSVKTKGEIVIEDFELDEDEEYSD